MKSSSALVVAGVLLVFAVAFGTEFFTVGRVI